MASCVVNFKLIASSLQLNGKYSTDAADHEFQLPLLYLAVQFEHLQVDTQLEKLLFVELFTVDSKVNRHFMSFSTNIDLTEFPPLSLRTTS